MKNVKTWNQSVVKKGNKTIVLETIMTFSPISRAKIANVTGLNKGTVSSLVQELLDEKLIDESGPGESSGGRRPVMLLFNQVAGYSIGIDIGVNYLLGVLTDLQGNICNEHLVKFSNLSYEEIKGKLFDTIDLLRSSAPSSPYGIIGIGIGVPGIVSNEGEIVLAPNLGWKNVDLQTALHEKYDVPIMIDNEANAGAYGEKRFGVGQSFNDIIYVSIGIGIGVGLILNGELYKGNNGFSGELGHMTIEVHGKNCRCGSKGCWELYASEQALLKRAERLGIQTSNNQEISLEDLLMLAEDGHKEAIHLFEEIGEYIGIGIKNIFNTFNPEQVIIGNRMASANKWLNESINKRLINQTLWPHQDDLQMNFSELSTHSTALGMAAFSVEFFLEGNLKSKSETKS